MDRTEHKLLQQEVFERELFMVEYVCFVVSPLLGGRGWREAMTRKSYVMKTVATKIRFSMVLGTRVGISGLTGR